MTRLAHVGKPAGSVGRGSPDPARERTEGLPASPTTRSSTGATGGWCRATGGHGAEARPTGQDHAAFSWSGPAKVPHPGRGESLVRPVDDRLPGRGCAGTGTTTDRLERDYEVIRGRDQFGTLGDDQAATRVAQLHAAEQGPAALVG